MPIAKRIVMVMATLNDSVHPEQQSDELFIQNMSDEQFARFNWNSKRQGAVAYDGDGRALSVMDWLPVFVAADELATRGTTVSRVRRELREQAEGSAKPAKAA